ncbi:MAG: hypothetical protein JRI77_08685 [Deltaproteobacteria bacterium]|nr:hypothetical protein [Deltaproteobacteria bacterium]
MKSILSNEYNKIFVGLIDLSRAARDYTTSLPQKLHAMEEIYLQRNPRYTDIEQRQIKYFGEAFAYKFHLANLHLEQLWSLTHMGNHPATLKDVLNNIFDSHQFVDDNLLLHSFAIEGFIIQGTAFLDFYMLYMCSIFKISETSYLSGKKFIKALEQVVEEPYKSRAEQVKLYFEKNVFGDSENGALLANNWGELLKKLRNSIVHRDMLYPDFRNDVTLLEKIIGKWPEKEIDLTCSRFCQDVQNVMFYQITKLAAIIYGLEWKPGPFKPDMWR